MTFDLERIVPELLRDDDPLERDTLELHRERYRFAARFVAGRRVVDVACGVGYGSAMLADAGAAAVIGVDVAEDALAHARRHYHRPHVTFVLADAATFVPDPPVTVAVSLETIEHLPDAAGFVRRLAELVGAGGIVVGSVPVTLSTDVNPYHLHDFTAAGFRRLFDDSGLDVIGELTQRQPFSPVHLLRLRARRTPQRRDYGLRPRLLRYYGTHPRMLARRIATTLRHGFSNEYLVLAGRRR
jgi:SAM-dependent methyltransferase